VWVAKWMIECALKSDYQNINVSLFHVTILIILQVILYN